MLFVALSYGKIDTSLYGLSGSTLLPRGSCCGLTSSVVSFQFFALVLSMCVSMCVVQKKYFRSSSSCWGAPRLDLFAKAPYWPSSNIDSLWKQSRGQKIGPYRGIGVYKIFKDFVNFFCFLRLRRYLLLWALQGIAKYVLEWLWKHLLKNWFSSASLLSKIQSEHNQCFPPHLPSKMTKKSIFLLKHHEISLNVIVGHNPIGINVKIALRGRSKEGQL